MLPEKWLDYIEENFLLKNEFIDVMNISEDNGIYNVPIIKRTARIRRIVARLIVGTNEDNLAPEELMRKISSPKAKNQLQISNENYDWIRNGWIIQEHRLQNDERSVKDTRYRMGYSLYEHKLQIQKRTKEESKKLILDWKYQWVKNNKSSKAFKTVRHDFLLALEKLLNEIADETDLLLEGECDKLGKVNTAWRFKKQVLFAHFLLALYQLAAEEQHFDWKQIGARYYRRIGGSKEFDAYKKEFIDEAERILELPLHLFGLASLGTITPIFFTGEMQARNASYSYGSVHATTDLAVLTDTYQTGASILWLVENRGVLTRMAYEEQFLIESKSLVVGIDGQLRSAHRQLIKQLLTCTQQVIIWTDVDEAGLTIAKELSKVACEAGAVTKWVVPSLKVVTSMNEFQDIYNKTIHAARVEQEQEMGGVKTWKEWIKS